MNSPLHSQSVLCGTVLSRGCVFFSRGGLAEMRLGLFQIYFFEKAGSIPKRLNFPFILSPCPFASLVVLILTWFLDSEALLSTLLSFQASLAHAGFLVLPCTGTSLTLCLLGLVVCLCFSLYNSGLCPFPLGAATSNESYLPP